MFLKQEKLTNKQLSILRYLLKVRAATIHHLTFYLYPMLDINKSLIGSSELRNTQYTVRSLLNRDLINVAHRKNILKGKDGGKLTDRSVFYALSDKGLLRVYEELNITELNRNTATGFDYDLGYFEKYDPPLETDHFGLTLDIQNIVLRMNTLEWINDESVSGVFNGLTLPEIAEIPNIRAIEWDFDLDSSKKRKANICSYRDNLHSVIKENPFNGHKYKPDGEIKIISDDRAWLNETFAIKENALEHNYFVEADMSTERGEAIVDKFQRLRWRLEQYAETNQLQHFKGVIFVFKKRTKPRFIDTYSRSRYKSLYNAFAIECRKFLNHFTLIACTVDDLEQVIRSLRTENQWQFSNLIHRALMHPSTTNDFTPSEQSHYPLKPLMVREVGDFRWQQVTEDIFYLFMNIEGFNSLKWREFLGHYISLLHRERQSNPNVIIYPVATFTKLFAHPPIIANDFIPIPDDEVEFYKYLHLLDISTGRPIFYKDLSPIAGIPHKTNIDN